MLVDPEISQRKLGREVEAWRLNEADYRRRGWILLRADLASLAIEVAFVTLVPMGGTQLPIILPVIRLDYDNYDLWPPSLSFIDLYSGRPTAAALPAAWVRGPDGQPRNILMTNADGKQFLCLPGIREYHQHPDHDGDRWELYRGERRGSIAVICDRIWSTMTSVIAGVQMQIQPALLTPAAGMPLEQAQETAVQARAAYDAKVALFPSGPVSGAGGR